MKKAFLILASIVVILVGYTVLKAIIRLASGNYYNVEYYEIQSSEKGLISSIEVFKNNNPSYKYRLKKRGANSLVVDSSYYDSNGRYLTSFNIDTNKIVVNCMVIGESNASTSMIGLSSVLKPEINGVWSRINTSDLSWSENRKVKRAFEKEVLDKLDVKWKRESFW